MLSSSGLSSSQPADVPWWPLPPTINPLGRSPQALVPCESPLSSSELCGINPLSPSYPHSRHVRFLLTLRRSPPGFPALPLDLCVSFPRVQSEPDQSSVHSSSYPNPRKAVCSPKHSQIQITYARALHIQASSRIGIPKLYNTPEPGDHPPPHAAPNTLSTHTHGCSHF